MRESRSSHKPRILEDRSRVESLEKERHVSRPQVSLHARTGDVCDIIHEKYDPFVDLLVHRMVAGGHNDAVRAQEK